MKILVAVPTYENIYPDVFKALYDMDKGGNDVDFNFFRGYDAANARIKIGRACLKGMYDKVLMVDNDTVVPQNALPLLLESMEGVGRPCMASGYYLSRPKDTDNESGRTAVFKFGPRYLKELQYTASEIRTLKEAGSRRVQVMGVGLGCALIDRGVFERVRMPWFEWHIYENGLHLSEDLFFCRRMETAGLPMFVNTMVPCGHMMRHVKWP